MQFSQEEIQRLHLMARKAYLLFLAHLVTGIDAGDVQAAELYPHLEDTWAEIDRWYQSL